MRRSGGRAGGGTVIIPPSRPPVLLQINENNIRAGTVSDAAPRRIISYELDKTADRWPPDALYRFWAPLLQDVYDSLGQDTKDRRAVVILPEPTLETENIRQKWKEVFLRILFDVIGVPSVSLQTELLFLPFAFPMLSTMIVVNVTSKAVSCFVHSNERSLPFTLHTVPLEITDNIVSHEWTKKLERQFLDAYYPQSMLFAILKTLETCPLSIRREAIQNLIFSGEVVVYRPDLPLRAAKKLKQLLEQGKLPEEEPEQETGPYPTVMEMVPIDLVALKPLASSVGLIDTRGTVGPFRADLLSWIGASLFAAHSYQNNPDAFHWIAKNTEEA